MTAVMRTISRSILLVGVAFLATNDVLVEVAAFSTSSPRTAGILRNDSNSISALQVFTKSNGIIDNPLSLEKKSTTTTQSTKNNAAKQTALAVSLAIALAAGTATTALPANAYIPSDYASDTVQTAIQDLKSSSGKNEETFKVYESIAAIITEGKGIGGQINYKGIELERGYVADEDTSIYNPGLSLLTESEKERLVEGVIDTRKAGLKAKEWSENNEYAYEFLRTKLDPLHMVELRGFLNIVPFYGAAIYIAVVAVQQIFRDAFQAAYLIGVAAFFLPIVGLVLAGP